MISYMAYCRWTQTTETNTMQGKQPRPANQLRFRFQKQDDTTGSTYISFV